MSNDEPTLSLYSDKDMIDVCDANGLPIPGIPVAPKAWLGTALVPPGTKKGKAKTLDEVAADAADSSSTTRAPRAAGVEPPKNGAGSGLGEWEAFAKEKGATDQDLLDEVGEPLDRAALIAKYGSKS